MTLSLFPKIRCKFCNEKMARGDARILRMNTSEGVHDVKLCVKCICALGAARKTILDDVKEIGGVDDEFGKTTKPV